MQTLVSSSPQLERAAWLRKLYFIRAAFSLVWVGLVHTVAKTSPVLAMILLIAYPAWDALANLLDVKMTGGAKANPTQVLNIWISTVVTAAVAIAPALGLHIALIIFGIWAIFSGLMQLATAIRRRKSNRGQWVMMLSGAQSVLAGCLFLTRQGSSASVAETVSGYAAVGAVYFLISGLVLLFRKSATVDVAHTNG